MYLFFVIVHVCLCLFLISVILLQPGKGADAGAAFGGGATSSMFGPRGPTSLLSQATTVVAVLFMCTSVVLALYSGTAATGSGGADDLLDELQLVPGAPDQVKPALPSEEAPVTPTNP